MVFYFLFSVVSVHLGLRILDYCGDLILVYLVSNPASHNSVDFVAQIK